MSKYRRKKLVFCTCGFITTIGNIDRHVKSERHQKRISHYFTPIGRPKKLDPIRQSILRL